MEKIFLDTTGKDCPIPLMELKKVVETSESGQLIDLIFTCPDAIQNIPRYAKENNHQVVEFEQLSNQGWRMLIKV